MRREDATMTNHPVCRLLLAFVQAFVGLTAVAGGVALIVGALDPGLATVLSPPVSYLAGTPFTGYLVPGILLAIGLGGVHLAALWMLVNRHPLALTAAAVAGFDTTIWIVVELLVMRFSPFQVVYFAAGLTELGLLLLMLGLLSRRTALPTA
jgi:hypothetical protein